MAIQIPVGAGPAARARRLSRRHRPGRDEAADLRQREAGAEVDRRAEIPAELRDEAELWREQMLEKLFDYSNELTELVLAEAADPGRADPQACCARRRCSSMIVPVLCGSALDDIGVQPLLDAVAVLSAQPGRRAAGRRRQSRRRKTPR